MDSRKCSINLKPDKKLGFIIEARGECKPLLATINENQGPYSKKVFNRRWVNIDEETSKQQSDNTSE